MPRRRSWRAKRGSSRSGTGKPGYQARFFAALCARHGFAPTVAAQANSIETMLGMVSAGLGVAPRRGPCCCARRRPTSSSSETPGETFDVVAATVAPGAATR